MVLTFIQLGILIRSVIEYLEFAHAVVGGVTLSRISNCQSIVAAWRQFEFEASDEISQVLMMVDRTAVIGFADDGAVFYLVIVNGAIPSV